MYAEGSDKPGERDSWSGRNKLQRPGNGSSHHPAKLEWVRGFAYHNLPCEHKRIQPGAFANTLAQSDNAGIKIDLDGSKATEGLYIRASNSVNRTTIKGLAIHDFGGRGIRIEDGDKATTNVVIQGNYIGTDRDGTDRLTNDDMGNGTGVGILSPRSNDIGGVGAGEPNVISNSNVYGIHIERSSYDSVKSNLIGTDRTRQRNLGNNVGVAVQDSHNTFIGWNCAKVANTIAYSADAGVQISEGTDNILDNTYGNRVECNSTYSNGGMEIDLGTTGVTPNDVNDVDSGVNILQNFAVITSARRSATGETTIKGTLDSVPSLAYRVDLFSNPRGTDEGKKFIGSVYLSSNATGDYSFSFSTKKSRLRQNITATVTSYYGISEFSVPKKVMAF